MTVRFLPTVAGLAKVTVLVFAICAFFALLLLITGQVVPEVGAGRVSFGRSSIEIGNVLLGPALESVGIWLALTIGFVVSVVALVFAAFITVAALAFVALILVGVAALLLSPILLVAGFVYLLKRNGKKFQALSANNAVRASAVPVQ